MAGGIGLPAASAGGVHLGDNKGRNEVYPKP